MFRNFIRKSCRLWDNVGKYGKAGQATEGNIIWRMRIAFWIPKAKDTHSEYAILIFSKATTIMRKCLDVTLYIHCYLVEKKYH